MHKEILTAEQIRLLPFVKDFADDYYLAGGTAIALHIGHRRSIDFDLFKSNSINRNSIKRRIEKQNFRQKELIFEAADQIHFLLDSVKFTFMNFPFPIKPASEFEGLLIPSLLDLAAMKSYALGGRAKWKDYVDLYFILKDHYSFSEISIRTRELFHEFFNPKLFREQLAFFDDIDYSEEIEFIGKSIEKNEVKEYLIDIATSPF